MDQVSGVDCVITANNKSYTYSIYQGKITLVGEGDLHDHRFCNQKRSTSLTNKAFDNNIAVSYTLAMYPNAAMLDAYSTSNRLIAAFGVGCVIVLTSFMFLLYDCLVSENIRRKGSMLVRKINIVYSDVR